MTSLVIKIRISLSLLMVALTAAMPSENYPIGQFPLREVAVGRAVNDNKLRLLLN